MDGLGCFALLFFWLYYLFLQLCLVLLAGFSKMLRRVYGDRATTDWRGREIDYDKVDPDPMKTLFWWDDEPTDQEAREE